MRPTQPAQSAEPLETISLCSLLAGGRNFGIDTRSIREVLGTGRLTRVPLAPAYIGGVIAYRGDVLTTLSLRALLGMAPACNQGRVLVLDEACDEERFGLLVDHVGGVVSLPRQSMDPIPATLPEPMRSLFRGAFRTGQTLLVELDPEHLRPGWLSEAGFFRRASAAPQQPAGEVPCAP